MTASNEESCGCVVAVCSDGARAYAVGLCPQCQLVVERCEVCDVELDAWDLDDTCYFCAGGH